MRYWLAFLLLLSPVSVLADAGLIGEESMTPLSGSETCITLGGDTLQESFDSAGYDAANWTEDANNPDEDNTDTLTNAPCFTGQYLKGSGSDIWARNDHTDAPVAYISMYFYITAESITDGNFSEIGWLEGTSPTEMRLHDDAGSISFEIERPGEGVLGTATSISLNTQYLLQIFRDATNDDMSFYIYDKDETLINSAVDTNYTIGDMDKLLIGPVNAGYSVTMYWDLVDIDTSGFPVGSPAK